MQHPRYRFVIKGLPLVIASALNLLLLLCIFALLGNHRQQRFGFTVSSAATHFVMGGQYRDRTHYLSIFPGDTPRLFLETSELKGGLAELGSRLDALKGDKPGEVVIVVVADEAVPGGVLMQVMDCVKMRGFVCNFAGRPSVH